jgi:Mn2+/Fe2+ NRAMP family transporter
MTVFKPLPADARDPYQYHAADVETPPAGLWRIFRRIGPGMILAASIVGSGELIATTTLGAETGYAALWIVLFSCFIKPAVQAAMGRHTIATGETALGMLNAVPGPRWKVNWVVWACVLMLLGTTAQLGAMLGGVAQTLNRLLPAVPEAAWVLGLAALTLALLLGGGYGRIEGLATIKVALFTLLTALCAVLLTRRSDLFTWSDLGQGFTFDLPRGGVATAIAVFGITGVGASELLMYPYWCVEKGYARFTGKREPGAAWRSRALGWIRVMHVDILATMVIYTLATIAFYLLGAGILHRQGLVPSATDMIPVLSRIYTETLGGWALGIFYAGAIATLYGTVFAATAAQSRILADFCRLAGWYPATDLKAWNRWRDGFMVLLIGIAVVLVLVFASPVQMVRFGGAGQALLLPVLAVSTLYLHHRRTPREVRTPPLLATGLWVAALSIAALMSYYAVIVWRG